MYYVKVCRNGVWHTYDRAENKADAERKVKEWKAYIQDPNLVIKIEPDE